ncbi:hypothetical protein HK096_007381, partial [Nowakowskiella sp. JEL0078]
SHGRIKHVPNISSRLSKGADVLRSLSDGTTIRDTMRNGNLSSHSQVSQSTLKDAIKIQKTGWLGGSDAFDRSLPIEEASSKVPGRTASLGNSGRIDVLKEFWNSNPHVTDMIVAREAYVNRRKDELSVKIGDPVSIYHTFPDSWVLGMNWRSGLSGMCPLSILDPEECQSILNDPVAQEATKALMEELRESKRKVSNPELRNNSRRPRSVSIKADRGSVISVDTKRRSGVLRKNTETGNFEIINTSLDNIFSLTSPEASRLRKPRPASVISRRSERLLGFSEVSEFLPELKENVTIVFDEKPFSLPRKKTARNSIIMSSSAIRNSLENFDLERAERI